MASGQWTDATEIPAAGIASFENVSKEVKFDLNPTVHNFDPKLPINSKGSKDSSVITPKFQVFFANITSLSKKACDVLFTSPET